MTATPALFIGVALGIIALAAIVGVVFRKKIDAPLPSAAREPRAWWFGAGRGRQPDDFDTGDP